MHPIVLIMIGAMIGAALAVCCRLHGREVCWPKIKRAFDWVSVWPKRIFIENYFKFRVCILADGLRMFGFFSGLVALWWSYLLFRYPVFKIDLAFYCAMEKLLSQNVWAVLMLLLGSVEVGSSLQGRWQSLPIMATICLIGFFIWGPIAVVAGFPGAPSDSLSTTPNIPSTAVAVYGPFALCRFLAIIAATSKAKKMKRGDCAKCD